MRQAPPWQQCLSPYHLRQCQRRELHMVMLGCSLLFGHDHTLTEAYQSISGIESFLEQFSGFMYVFTTDLFYIKTRFRKYFHNLR